jgi:hypothetical protein
MAMQNVFTGKTGRITLHVPAASPETNDAKALFKNYGNDESPPVGRATNIEVVVQTDLEEFHEIGARLPVVLHPGNTHIGGRIERAYLSGLMVGLLLGRGISPDKIKEPYVQPSFGIIVDLIDPAVTGNDAQLVLDGVKFENWGMTMPEDDFVMENVTFKALTLHIVDKEAPPGSGAAVEHKPFKAS